MSAALHPVDAYAADVVAGKVPAGKFHRLACLRHLKDRAREGTADFPYIFEPALADRFFAFAEKLKHYKGRWAGQYIELQPHQKFRKGCKHGWVHAETGLRRFRNSYEELPRKSGKSLEAAIETLYVTFFTGEPGAEGYCVATKRDQAMLVFGDCKKLVKSSGLRNKLSVLTSRIYREDTDSKLQPLSADYNSMDGLNVSMVNIDEMHALKNRGLIDVMETATGAREEPLVNKITTAGDDPISPCGDEHDYACKVLEGVLVDETYFAFIAHADVAYEGKFDGDAAREQLVFLCTCARTSARTIRTLREAYHAHAATCGVFTYARLDDGGLLDVKYPGDDWTSMRTAAKANPNYGVSVSPEDLQAKVTKALGIEAAAASYQQKHLNLWVNASAPCLSMDGWQRGQSEWDPADLEHEPCYVGIDLGAKLDLCSMTVLFPPAPGRAQLRLLQFIWTPADTIIERARRDRAPYPLWVDRKWLRAVPGTSVDQEFVRRALLDEVRNRYDIELIGYDQWHADQLMKTLQQKDGLREEQLIEVPQTYAGLGAAELRFKGEVLAGTVDARRCPVTKWAASNVVEQTDGKGNIFFTKKRSRGRIDPIKSATIAAAVWLRAGEATEEYQVLVYGGHHDAR